MYTKTAPTRATRRCRLKLLTLVVVTQMIGACNTNTASTAPSPLPPPPPTLRTISVSGPWSIALGASAQFTATAEYSDGTSADVTAAVTWTTSNARVLTIASDGGATAVQEGEAHVQAAKDGVRSDAGVLVLLRPGTYRLSGRLVSRGQPIAGFDLDVVEGTGAGIATFTDSSGRYVLSGLAGVVRIRFSMDGTPYLTCTANVTDHTVIDIDLGGPIPSGCRYGL